MKAISRGALIAALAGLLQVCLGAADARAATVKVFILAGQSNMDGQGFIAAGSTSSEALPP